MAGIDIKFLNADKIIQGLNDRVKNIESTLEKTAKGMGVLACNEIHPLTHKKTGNWDSTIHAEVSKLGPMKYELWVGSRGAFNGSGYNYGARQEKLNHPIERGWQSAQGEMKDLFQRNITAGLQGKSITGSVSGPDEMSTMAGI
jgi:hypothetical protein